MCSIVQERLGSAIIMEDDTDWDVTIKTQLQSFALAVRALQNTYSTSPTSPYGNDWDMFWLGHCGIECNTDIAHYLVPNDPTILPPRHFSYLRDQPPIQRQDDTRLTCAIKDGVCSNVYAVSYRGAQRILAALSVDPAVLANEVDTGAQFDVSLGRMCKTGYIRCFAPYTALTGSSQLAGSSGKSSDIHGGDGDSGGKVEEIASWGVKYSTMMNIHRILRGEDTVHSHFDGVEVPDVHPGDVPVLVGFRQSLDG